MMTRRPPPHQLPLPPNPQFLRIPPRIRPLAWFSGSSVHFWGIDAYHQLLPVQRGKLRRDLLTGEPNDEHGERYQGDSGGTRPGC